MVKPNQNVRRLIGKRKWPLQPPPSLEIFQMTMTIFGTFDRTFSQFFFVEATMLNSKNFILRILLEIPHRQKKIWQLTVQHANLIKMHLKLLLEFKVYNFSYHCSEICASYPHEIYPYMKILEKFWTQRDIFIVCNQFHHSKQKLEKFPNCYSFFQK